MRSVKASSVADFATTTAPGWQQVPVETVELVPAPMEMQPKQVVLLVIYGKFVLHQIL